MARLSSSILFRGLGILALIALATAPADADDLTVVNYGGNIQLWSHDNYWKPFTAETGINIVEDSRDYGIGIVRTKVEGGSNTWDVVAAEDIEVVQGCEEGLFQKLDWSKISGKAGFLPQAVLPCAEGEVIYDMMIGYDGNRIKDDGPQNWRDFWNVKKWPGKRVLYKDPRDSLEAALMADGVPRDQVYAILAKPEGVDRAFKKLDEIKSDLLWWTNPGQARQLLISGDAVMAATYGGGLILLNQTQHMNFKLSWNDALLHIDYWAIIRGTPHMAAAIRYLDFVSRPDRQATFANNSLAGIPNRDAAKLIDAAVYQNQPTMPEHLKVALPSNPQFWLENYDKLNQRFTAWLSH